MLLAIIVVGAVLSMSVGAFVIRSQRDGTRKTEMVIMLSRMASKNKIELEAALYKRMDEIRKQTS